MYTFNSTGTALHFEFPEGQIDLNEVLQAVGLASRVSLRDATPIRVTIAGMDDVGAIETRNTPGRIYPPIVEETTYILQFPAQHGYDVWVSSVPSPFYRLCIPGVMEILDGHVLFLCPDFAIERYDICNLIFNISVDALIFTTQRQRMPPSWRLYAEDYINIRTYRDMLAKKPRFAKAVDFAPVLVKLFGEKIAAAILKEIK